jgi:hypothetical protein
MRTNRSLRRKTAYGRRKSLRNKRKSHKKRGGANDNNGIVFVPYEERSTQELLADFLRLPDQSSLDIDPFVIRLGIIRVGPRELIGNPLYYNNYRRYLEENNPILRELMKRLRANPNEVMENQIEKKIKQEWREIVRRIAQRRGLSFPYEVISMEDMLEDFLGLPDQSQVHFSPFVKRIGNQTGRQYLIDLDPRELKENPLYYDTYLEYLKEKNPILEELMKRLRANPNEVIENQIEEKIQEKWRQLVRLIAQRRRLPDPYEVRITNANFEVPNRINEFLPIKANAENEITMELINMKRPVMILNDEEQYGRYYQNETSIRVLKESKKNPFTQKNIKKTTWYKPERKNNNKSNNKQ